MKHRRLKIFVVFVVVPLMLVGLGVAVFSALRKIKAEKEQWQSKAYYDQKLARNEVGDIIPILSEPTDRFLLELRYSEPAALKSATARYYFEDGTECIMRSTDEPNTTTKYTWSDGTHSIGYNVYKTEKNRPYIQFCISYRGEWFQVWIYTGGLATEECIKNFFSALEN